MGMSASQARLLTVTSRMSDVEFTAQQIANSKTRLADQSEQVTKAYSDALDQKKLVFQTGMQNSTAIYVDLTANLLMSYKADSTEPQRILTNANGQVLVSSSTKNNYNLATAPGGGGFESFLNSYNLSSSQALADAHNNATPKPTTTWKYDKDQVTYYKNIYDAAQAGGGMIQPDNDKLLNDTSWIYDQFNNGKLFLQKWNTDENAGKGGFKNTSWQSGDSQIQEVTDTQGIDQIKAKYDADMSSINNKDKKFDLQQKSLDTEHSALQTEYDSVKKVIDKNIERSYKIFNG